MNEPTESQTDDGVATAKESRAAQPWLDLIAEAERQFQPYQDKCEKVEKLYADLKSRSQTADREFAMFWANLEVLKPALYSRAPVPVVATRNQDKRELARLGAELLERSLIVSFERDDLDSTMKLVRDDLAMNARGVVWPRYEGSSSPDEGDMPGYDRERVCKEHLDRTDFLHDPARKWREVEWVARGSWLTRERGVKRFGDVFKKVELKAKDSGKGSDAKGEKRGRVWEMWHKTANRVIWLSPGCDEVLDIREPFLTLENFFPCPRPAYGTLQPRTLIPVPDMIKYADQLEEVNELTARISKLSEALKLKGFYNTGGSGDLSTAIEKALADTSNAATMVGISSSAAFAPGTPLKDQVVWLPVDMVATVIRDLIALRRQLIDDIYQLSGLSDIMRGSTDPNETLGAQQLKSQYGSVRIRDRQQELVRVARDVTRIEAEIMAENFAPATLMDMSQMIELPTEAVIGEQIAQIEGAVQQAASNPQVLAQAQQNPEAAQQALQQAQAQIEALQAKATLEKVVDFLRNQRLRAFSMEIETDSTIQPDEDAAKRRASEFVTAVGGFMSQTIQTVNQVPEAAPLAAETLKFVAGQFRAGRPMLSMIDEFAEKMKQAASQPKGPAPELIKAQAEAKREDAKIEIERSESQHKMRIEDQKVDLEQQRLDDTKAIELLKLKVQEIEDENGLPVPIDLQTMRTLEALAQTNAMIAGLAQSLNALAQAQQVATAQQQQSMTALLAAITAPVELIRDPVTGKPISARKLLPTMPGVN